MAVSDVLVIVLVYGAVWQRRGTERKRGRKGRARGASCAAEVEPKKINRGEGGSATFGEGAGYLSYPLVDVTNRPLPTLHRAVTSQGRTGGLS